MLKNALRKPKAILFDLDDTILPAFARPDMAWSEVVDDIMADTDAALRARIVKAIQTQARDFWSDGERHRLWRVRLPDLRRGWWSTPSRRWRSGAILPDELGLRLADRFTRYAEEQIDIFHDAHDVLGAFARARLQAGAHHQRRGWPAARQGRTIRPRPPFRSPADRGRGFRQAGGARLPVTRWRSSASACRDTWMVGDHLEWEVVAPQKLGITAVWFDHRSRACPSRATSGPTWIVTSLTNCWSACRPERASRDASRSPSRSPGGIPRYGRPPASRTALSSHSASRPTRMRHFSAFTPSRMIFAACRRGRRRVVAECLGDFAGGQRHLLVAHGCGA